MSICGGLVACHEVLDWRMGSRLESACEEMDTIIMLGHIVSSNADVIISSSNHKQILDYRGFVWFGSWRDQVGMAI
jgi:hypothetical protein